MLTPADMPPGYVLVVSVPDRVRIEDVSDADLFIDGDTDAAGVLTFKIESERADGSRATVRGKVLFDLMMQHFSAGVVAVRGYWTYGPNLAEFNRLTGLGWGRRRAAGETWTGQRAKVHGFSVALRVQALGSQGHYGLAEFLFFR